MNPIKISQLKQHKYTFLIPHMLQWQVFCEYQATIHSYWLQHRPRKHCKGRTNDALSSCRFYWWMLVLWSGWSIHSKHVYVLKVHTLDIFALCSLKITFKPRKLQQRILSITKLWHFVQADGKFFSLQPHHIKTNINWSINGHKTNMFGGQKLKEKPSNWFLCPFCILVYQSGNVILFNNIPGGNVWLKKEIRLSCTSVCTPTQYISFGCLSLIVYTECFVSRKGNPIFSWFIDEYEISFVNCQREFSRGNNNIM